MATGAGAVLRGCEASKSDAAIEERVCEDDEAVVAAADACTTDAGAEASTLGQKEFPKA